MTPDEARDAMLRIGAPIEDRMARVSWEMPEELKGEDVPPLTRGLWYASRLHGEVMGAGSGASADEAFEMLRYIFEPPQNEEEWAAYKDWATSTASWSDMPKGALGVELPADLVATLPGIYLGARDVIKDFANDEQSWWNLFDLAGVLPVVGIPGTVRRLAKNSDEIAKAAQRAVRAAKRADDVRISRVIRPSYIDEPGSRAGVYIFDTPKGQVEVTVEPPGQHNYSGYRDQMSETHHITGMPEGEDIARADETIWTAIKMKDGEYARGYEDTLGKTILREIYSQLGDLFPEARYVGGHRVTGSAVQSGPASANPSGGRDLWVYMGDRTEMRAQGANRQLLALAEADPVEFEKVRQNMAAEGIDVSLPVLRQREAEQLARGLPYQLTPIQLKRHERELERIAMGYDDWAEAVEDQLDYLEGVGIEARNYDTGEPTTLGHALIESATGSERSLAEVLNPIGVPPEDFEKALEKLELSGVNPKTGHISAQQAYIERVQNTMLPRLEGLLRAEMDDFDRIVFRPGEDGGSDIINAFNEAGENVLHMQLQFDRRYSSGLHIDDLQSPVHGEAVTQRVADNLRRADVGLSEQVQELTTVGQQRAAAAAARRTQVAGISVPGQDHMEHAARVADDLYAADRARYSGDPDALMDDVYDALMGGGDWGDGMYTGQEASELVDALGALSDGRTSSQQSFLDLVSQEAGTMTRNQYGEDIGSAAGRQLRQGNDPEQAAMQLVLQGFDPREARIAVSSAQGGPSPVSWSDEFIRELEGAAGGSGTQLAPEAQAIAEGAGEIVEAGPRTRRASPSNTVDENIAAVRAARERGVHVPEVYPNNPRWALNPDDPDDRYIEVFRRHRDADAPLDPQNPRSRTGNEGREGDRRATYPEYYHARTPFYVKGQAPEPMVEGYPIQIEARIPESRFYDIHADPKGYVQKYRDGELEDFTLVEDLIKRDGDYAAFGDLERGQVWAFDELQETNRVHTRDGRFMDSYGAPLQPGQTPFTARGIDPNQHRGIGVTQAQQRSRIRQGTAAEYEMQAWPELAGAEAGRRGDMLFDEARRLHEGTRRVADLNSQESAAYLSLQDRTLESVTNTPVLEAQRMIQEYGLTPEEARRVIDFWVEMDDDFDAPIRWTERMRERMAEFWPDESGEVTKGMPTPEPQGPRMAGGRGADAFNNATPPAPTEWDHMVAATLNEGNGVSIGLDGNPLPQRLRYVVSPNKNTETIFEGGAITAQEVATFRELHKGALSEKGAVFGAWLDDGKLYMDVSRGFSNQKAAMDVAQVGDQMSVADRKFLPKATGGLADEADWDKAFISNELFDEGRGVTNWPTERARAEARVRVYDHMPELAAQADERMLRNMGPQTSEWYANSRPHVQARVREMYRLMLSDDELATMMALGEQTKGWYEGAAGTIRNAYGAQDAPQFTALLAATSPNVPVESNVRFAQDMWAEWNAQGRPRDPDAIQDMFNDVAGGLNLEGHQVVPNANLNTIEVLSHPEPYEWFGDPEVWARGDVLSGEKVDPFFANSIGELRRMTVDTHQLRYGPAPATSLSRRAAFEAGFTGGAEELSRALEMPEALKVAHGQEMSWEPMRQLGEMAGRGRGSVEDIMFNPDGSLNMETIAELDRRMKAANDFGQYLGSPEGRQMVERAGGNPEFEIVNRTGLDPEQAAAARQRVIDNPEHVRAATRRSDMGYAGDHLFNLAPWLVGGAGAGIIGRHLDPNDEKPPQQPELPRGLFDGASLPFVGSSGSN
jgi:hypothetical protein